MEKGQKTPRFTVAAIRGALIQGLQSERAVYEGRRSAAEIKVATKVIQK